MLAKIIFFLTDAFLLCNTGYFFPFRPLKTIQRKLEKKKIIPELFKSQTYATSDEGVTSRNCPWSQAKRDGNNWISQWISSRNNESMTILIIDLIV